MQERIGELETRVARLAADDSSPITERAACALMRDVLIPMLESEIKTLGWYGVAKKWAYNQVRALFQRYVDKHCVPA